MKLKSGFQFLAAAAATVALLAFAQPALAQSYSDSFEGPTINPWWTLNIRGDLSYSFSTTQHHTGSRSLQVHLTNNGGDVELTHAFSAPVRGDFSVWVYDDPSVTPLQVHSFSQSLQISSADGQRFVQILYQLGGGMEYGATTYDGVTPSSCNLASRATSAEWRKLRAIVGDTGITFQVENASGIIAGCNIPYTAALTNLLLHTGDESLVLPPIPVAYIDDFSYTAPETGYTVSLLYDPLQAVKRGSTLPVTLQLLSGGVNVSAPKLVVHAVAILKMDNSAASQVLNAGNANPDFDFRYDPALGGTGGYILNLRTTGLTTELLMKCAVPINRIFDLFTTGLTTGNYHLKFQVNGLGDYTAPFAVK